MLVVDSGFSKDDVFECKMINETILVDGRLNEWPLFADFILDTEKNITKISRYDYNYWRGKKDLSAKVYMRFNPYYIFFALEIIDDTLYNPTGIERGDAIELFFDTEFERDRTQTEYNDDDFHFIFAPKFPQASDYNLFIKKGSQAFLKNPSYSGILFKIYPTQEGYHAEIAVPFSAFWKPLIFHYEMGINIAITDQDDPDHTVLMSLNGRGDSFLDTGAMIPIKLISQQSLFKIWIKIGRILILLIIGFGLLFVIRRVYSIMRDMRQIKNQNQQLQGEIVNKNKIILDSEKLVQASRVLGSTINFEQLVKLAVDLAKEIIQAEKVLLVMREGEGKGWTLNGQIGYSENEIAELAKGIDYLGKESLQITGTLSLIEARFIETNKIPSFISKFPTLLIPLIHQSESIGLLVATRTSIPNHSFKTSEIHYYSAFASQMATTIYNAKFFNQVIYDPDTGMYSHNYFNGIFSEEFIRAERFNRPLTYMRCDIHDFNHINRIYGREIGNMIILKISQILKSHLRQMDKIGRLGGDEFEVIFLETDLSTAEKIVERLLLNFEEESKKYFGLKKEIRQITLNNLFEIRLAYGLGSYPNHAQSKENLIDYTDKQLFSVKQKLNTQVNVSKEDDDKIDSVVQNYPAIVIKSPVMKELYKKVMQVASSDTTILLLGESGSGKGLIAQLIHDHSPRKEGPLVYVSCAAIPDTLMESELFGHERGAFTGADRRTIGKFEEANGGTIFLDEIGEINPPIQVKLLRFLQDKKLERLGGVETISADVRIIAATNKDLQQLVKEGKFREDIYYRLNVISFVIPPLRQRKEEIKLLIDKFIDRYNKKNGKNIQKISLKALDLLYKYDWPGNIRELENSIERAVVLCTGPVITEEQLPYIFNSLK